MKKIKIKNLLIILLAISIPGFAFATSCRNQGIDNCFEPKIVNCGENCTLDVLPDVICRGIDFLKSCLAVPIAVLMLIIGGIYFLFAGGNPENIEKGRKAIMAVIIALLIIFLALALLNALLNAIGGPELSSSTSLQTSQTSNGNQQPYVTGQTLFFIGVNTLLENEELPPPDFQTF